MNESHERATAAAIPVRKNIVSCWAKLGFLVKRIYSLTTDNESDVLKVGELMRSDLALPENFANQNDEDGCDVHEASDSGLWEDVITTEDGIITVRCAVYTIQQSVHDFFKDITALKKWRQK